MSTDVKTFLEDLNGGVFEEKLSTVLSDVAANVVTQGKPGKVQVTFDIEQIGNGYQVQVKHKLTYSKPTLRGKVTEEDTTITPMHLGRGGRMTLFPEGQEMLFDKKGNPNPPHKVEE